MPIPQEVLAVERPRGTVVKYSMGRYLVIKRTSRYDPNKSSPRPVDLGTIGEIIDGHYFEIRKEPKKVADRKKINIKTYGTMAVCHKVGKPLLQELKACFSNSDAEKLYSIATMRVCEPDIKNRDIKMAYDTSFLSETIPEVALSENTICKFLRDTGLEYLSIQKFLKNRAARFKGGQQVLDGTLKDYNSDRSGFSEFSRKGRVKGSKDMSLMYSYDMKTKEPILMKSYAGNVLDQRAVRDFVQEFSISNAILVMDKGFYSKDNVDLFKSMDGLTYVLPLNRNMSVLTNHDMYKNINTSLFVNEKNLVYKKVKVDDSTFLYSFRDPKIAFEEEILFLKTHSDMDPDTYEKEKMKFGVISFETNRDLSAEDLFMAYEGRWEIETLFKMFKEILDLDTENVHSDSSAFTTEFINYLSVIIGQRLKALFEKTVLKVKKNKKGEVVSTTSVADSYSFKQTIRYLSKIKKVKTENDAWITNYEGNTKYIEELAIALGI